MDLKYADPELTEAQVILTPNRFIF